MNKLEQNKEQNRTRDMEIRNKLTVVRGEGEGGNRRTKEKGLVKKKKRKEKQGTQIANST